MSVFRYQSFLVISTIALAAVGQCHTLAMQFLLQRATGATKMNEVSSRSHAVCIIIVEKCTTNLNGNTDSAAAAAAAAMGVDNMGLLMASGGPSSRKAVAAAAALTQQLQHSIKVSGLALPGLSSSADGVGAERPPKLAVCVV